MNVVLKILAVTRLSCVIRPINLLRLHQLVSLVLRVNVVSPSVLLLSVVLVTDLSLLKLVAVLTHAQRTMLSAANPMFAALSNVAVFKLTNLHLLHAVVGLVVEMSAACKRMFSASTRTVSLSPAPMDVFLK